MPHTMYPEGRDEYDRRQTIQSEYTQVRDDAAEGGRACAFAKELEALIAKHGFQAHREEILEGAREALVSRFHNYAECYAAFEDAAPKGVVS